MKTLERLRIQLKARILRDGNGIEASQATERLGDKPGWTDAGLKFE
jgi:hypothetical protein